jgi:hypothetical protein
MQNRSWSSKGHDFRQEGDDIYMDGKLIMTLEEASIEDGFTEQEINDLYEASGIVTPS